MDSPSPSVALRLHSVIDSLSGELSARDYRTGGGLRLRWEAGRITEAMAIPLPANEPGALWVAPALFDLQINGYGGVDFQNDTCDEAALLAATQALRRDGCPRYLLTLITHPWPQLLARLARFKALRDGHPDLRRAIVGWHIEGPFLSREPGFIGAHDPGAVCDPCPQAMDQLKAVSGGDPVLLTLAPERPGSPETIRRAREHGFIVSAGHTNASRADLAAAAEAGLAAFTHLGNGCPQQLDRHDNILWRVFDRQPGLTAGLIPDTHHVSPQAFRLFHRVLPQIYWTTDAMSGAGAPPGRYRLGPHEIEVGTDRVARQPGKTNFAGSALEPFEGIVRGAAMLGEPWQAVWDFFSLRPARLLGLPAGLEPGAPALFCLVESPPVP